MANMTNMETLGYLHNTDKITHHGYHRFYPAVLEQKRNSLKTMLEIGIDKTCSLNMWLDYFPHAFIYGLDINLELSGERYKIIKADQSLITDLNRVALQISHPLDFIIDDGSHLPEHQLLTLNTYFVNLLQPGGIYIIEDIETSYWRNSKVYNYNTNYGLHHPQSIIEISKNIIDEINIEFISEKLQHKLPSQVTNEVKRWISTITFGQNCIILQKKTELEYTTYTNRTYRFLSHIQHQPQDIRIFYHLCCLGNWKDLLNTQFNNILFSGLYDLVSSIHIFVVANETNTHDIQTEIQKYGNKIKIEKIVKNGLENLCMEGIHTLVNDHTKFLYLHSKGVTRFGKTQYTDAYGTIHNSPKLYENINDWRATMEYFLVKHHKKCIELLDTHDIVGINFYTEGRPHFSGNFWWSTGKHYNSLPLDKPHGESYNTHFDANVISLHQTPLIGTLHYFYPYPPSSYIHSEPTLHNFIIKNGKVINTLEKRV